MVIGGGSTSALGQKSHIVAHYSQHFTDTFVKKTPNRKGFQKYQLDLNGHPLSRGSKGEENKTGHQSNPDRELGRAHIVTSTPLGKLCWLIWLSLQASLFNDLSLSQMFSTLKALIRSWCKSLRWLRFSLRTPRRKAGRYKRREAPAPGYQQTQFTYIVWSVTWIILMSKFTWP